MGAEQFETVSKFRTITVAISQFQSYQSVKRFWDQSAITLT